MQRKLSGGKGGMTATGMSVLKALRLALARVADDLFDLPLAVIGGTQARVALDAVGGQFKDGQLLIVLDGPDGQTGAASVSLSLVVALIQQQTMGKVLTRPAEPRPFTATDAALCAPLLDKLFERAAVLVHSDADKASLKGLKFGALAEDARSLALALRAEKFRMLDLTLDIAVGQHQGGLMLILPEPAQSSGRPVQDRELASEVAAESPLMNVAAELTAVLCKIRMPVSELSALKPGDVLPLSRSRLNETSLVSVTGRVIAHGSLGQMGGNLAVRLAGSTPNHAHAPGKTAEFDANLPVPLASVPEVEMQAEPAAVWGDDDLPHLPTQDYDDPSVDLPNMNAEETAAEITHLAGFSGDGMEEAPETEVTGGPV
jgi:flagellar motor switch/type III secretory pathway protein FliN